MWVLLLFGRKVLLIREREREVSRQFLSKTHTDRQQKVMNKKNGKKRGSRKKKAEEEEEEERAREYETGSIVAVI